ncbi:60S acidic ribosomal protein P0 [Saitozyma sp. JCM 24511]|nr:60S acidic ribosomal protein P0 [Saitozyma sp. JCM 24511]
MGGTRAEKEVYFTKLKALLEQYPSIFIVNIDNVSSQQLHMIRVSLRGKGVVLMGKNTMVRRAVRGFLGEFPQFEKVLPFIKGNIGFVFTSGDLKDIREIIVSNKVAAPARAGAVAPNDVFVPAGNTGMEPGKTSFFQALGIPTKIARGTIEIVNDVQVVSAGNKVGTSEATLLNMLNISPFTYGMTVVQVYDNGAVFPSSILDIEESTLLSQFTSGISTIAAISLAIGIPTVPSVVHSLVNSYKNLLAVSLATDYEFEGSKKLKEYLANPEAFAAAAAPAAAESAPAAAGEAAPAAKEEEKEESEDDDMGFGLFD